MTTTPAARSSSPWRVANVATAKKAWAERSGTADGVIFARDLVNEPANILYPEEFAKRATSLRKLGVAVEVLDVADMTKLGMGALLGVGQGSPARQPPRGDALERRQARRQPVAFIGKGVCFDTGGISIKPAGGHGGHEGDMAGAACVVGLMQSLASRKAKVNVIGAIGIVENMPDGNAQRPGDIVTSMSGQTIEIINTDAEGRLVLCDVLHYVNTKYTPKFMVNLATLTGAIIVALGQDFAGMFSNDDKLSERLNKAGLETGERVVAYAARSAYDKMIDSKFADMKNTGGRYGGSITAAQFLQRFVGKTPWAHLDIAGDRDGIAADRHQPELRVRAGACACSIGWWRTTTRHRVHPSLSLRGARVCATKQSRSGKQWCLPDQDCFDAVPAPCNDRLAFASGSALYRRLADGHGALTDDCDDLFQRQRMAEQEPLSDVAAELSAARATGPRSRRR